MLIIIFIVLDVMCQGKSFNKSTVVIIWEKGGVVVELYLQNSSYVSEIAGTLYSIQSLEYKLSIDLDKASSFRQGIIKCDYILNQ